MTHPTESSLGELLATSPERETAELLTIRAGGAERPLYGQDRMYFDRDNGLFVVCDGVGSTDNAGETAQVVVDAFAANKYLKEMKAVDDLNQASAVMAWAFTSAQARVSSSLRERAGSTTVAAIKFFRHNDRLNLVAGNAGDSRIMLWRQGTMSNITEEQCDPKRPNVITNWLGKDSQNRTAQDEVVILPLEDGDRVVVCSDGITGDKESERLSDAEFVGALALDDPTEAAENLLAISKKQDDKTVIVVNVEKSREVTTDYPDKTPLKEKFSRHTKRAAAFIAGLGVGQKLRGLDSSKIRTAVQEKSQSTRAWLTARKGTIVPPIAHVETHRHVQPHHHGEVHRHVQPRGFAAAKENLTRLYLRTENYMVSFNGRPEELTEEELRRRRWILNGAIGALALWGLYKALHGYDSSDNSVHEHINNGPSVSHPTPEVPPPVITPEPTPPQHPDILQGALNKGIGHFSPGDNPWNEGIDYANYLKYNVSANDPSNVPFIDAVKDEILRINHTSEAGARHIPVGTDWRMPSVERMADLYRLYGDKS